MSLRVVLLLSFLACVAVAAPVNTPHTRFVLNLITSYRGKEEINGQIFIHKNNQSRLLLDGGTALSVLYKPHTIAYFGGRDGIYVYDDLTEKLEKYGTIGDKIIGIVKSTNSDTLYIISEDHTVYKVTEGGTKKTKVDGADGATSIELDWQDNLYFIGADKQPYVVAAEGIKKIQGLPPFEGHVLLSKPPPEIKNAIYFITTKNNAIYFVFFDGFSRLYELSAEEKAVYDKDRQDLYKVIEGIRNLEKQLN